MPNIAIGMIKQRIYSVHEALEGAERALESRRLEVASHKQDLRDLTESLAILEASQTLNKD